MNEVSLPRRFKECFFQHRFTDPCPGNGKHGKEKVLLYFAPLLTCEVKQQCLFSIKLLRVRVIKFNIAG